MSDSRNVYPPGLASLVADASKPGKHAHLPGAGAVVSSFVPAAVNMAGFRMQADAARTGAERKAHALAALQARYAEVWVASASSGIPHLVPLSLAWDGQRVILSVDRRSATARNVISSGRARLALGETGDVVMIDADLEAHVVLSEASPELALVFAGQADWDPRQAGGLPGSHDDDYVFLCLLPKRIQVWRTASEHPGRTIMRSGRWVV